MAIISRANNEKTIQQRYGASNFRNWIRATVPPMPRPTRFKEPPHPTRPESITMPLEYF